ncbi:MAG: hypothetical protein SW833_06810 [Cyanobacteriota bacterium]|nr:hypothetical protein [Cyanobacteriota bacterium]
MSFITLKAIAFFAQLNSYTETFASHPPHRKQPIRDRDRAPI